MRLTLVIVSLDAGGAERVASSMASHWARAGHAVTLLTFTAPDRAPFYSLDPGVALRPLDLAGVSANPAAAVVANLHRIRALRRAFRASAPDVVIAYLHTTAVVSLLATRGLGAPVVVAEHTDPYLDPLDRAWAALRRLTYPWAARVVVLNQRALAYFPPRVRARARVIPNPVDVEPAPAEPGAASLPRPVLVAMGRLVPLKGHDLLLRAFGQLAARFPAWHLAVLGDGPERARLERLRDELGLTGRARFWGTVRDPQAWLRQADLFALPSRQEAFPLALAEALACGVPVVAAEYHAGVRDLVTDGDNGLLVPSEDVGALADALGRLMGDPAQRARLAARAAPSVERYGRARVMAMWDALLAEV